MTKTFTPGQIKELHDATLQSLRGQRLMEEAAKRIAAIVGGSGETKALKPVDQKRTRAVDGVTETILSEMAKLKDYVHVEDIAKLLQSQGLTTNNKVISKTLWRLKKADKVKQRVPRVGEKENARQPWALATFNG